MAREEDLPMPTDGETFDALLWAAQQPCVEHHRALRLVGMCPSCVLRLQAKQALEMWLQLSVLSLQAGVDRHAWRDALFDPFRRWRMAYEARRLRQKEPPHG